MVSSEYVPHSMPSWYRTLAPQLTYAMQTLAEKGSFISWSLAIGGCDIFALNCVACLGGIA